MAMWRIRVLLPDDADGREVLRNTLVPYQGRAASGRAPSAEATGDVIVELADDEPIGDLLLALHEISPQVFVSRADEAEAPAAGAGRGTARRRRIAIRQLRQGLEVPG